MKQYELMHAIGDAMERNPEGWWSEFNVFSKGHWHVAQSPDEIWFELGEHPRIRPKPRTYTLHVEDMPEPEYSHVFPANDPGTHSVYVHVRYPDEQTAREALEKLTKAMGGNNE